MLLRMIIIGELINSSISDINRLMQEKDEHCIQQIALAQVERGVNYLDVNAGTFIHQEEEYLKWLVQTIQAVTQVPLALDSPSPAVIEKALEVYEGTPMINSITAEEDKYQKLLPLVKGYRARVIGLCLNGAGMPETAKERLTISYKLINDLDKDGIPLEDVFIDPLLKPISVSGQYGLQVLDTIQGISNWNSGVHITCGLGNISFGMPRPNLLNQAFLAMALCAGADTAIVNPFDDYLMSIIKAAEVLLSRDPYGREFIKAAREKKLV